MSLAATATACGGKNDNQPVATTSPTGETPSATPSPTTSPTSKPTPAVPKSETTKKVEDFIKTSVPTTLKGVEATAVDCPPDVKIEAGKKFDCEVTIPQGKFKAAVEMKDDKGTITWNSKNVLNVASLEQTIKDEVKKQKQLDITIDCGSSKSPVRFFEKVGETFTCPATTADGKKGAAQITIKDETGQVSWKI
nr:DUF4333 domain-containing protein [Oscillatoria sp. FACHB-1406]